MRWRCAGCGPSLDRLSLGAFLRDHGQNCRTIDQLWSIISTATLNLPADEASLALAAKVFRTGLLDDAASGDIGWARAPLGRIHHDAALHALEGSGVECVLGTPVEAVGPGGVVRIGGAGAKGTEHMVSDTVVLAVPHQDAFALAPALRTGRAAPAAGLGASPIVNVHLIYERAVTDLPFAAAVESGVQWFFDRSASSGLTAQRPGQQYLALTVSAAADLVDVPSRDLVRRFVADLSALLPGARGVEVRDAFVTRERRATFRQAVGTRPMRPRPGDGPDGVWLAGAWADTGWPDTMESAVRSGIHAAEAALDVSASQRSNFAA